MQEVAGLPKAIENFYTCSTNAPQPASYCARKNVQKTKVMQEVAGVPKAIESFYTCSTNAVEEGFSYLLYYAPRTGKTHVQASNLGVSFHSTATECGYFVSGRGKRSPGPGHSNF